MVWARPPAVRHDKETTTHILNMLLPPLLLIAVDFIQVIMTDITPFIIRSVITLDR
jgi:hypothetical protein